MFRTLLGSGILAFVCLPVLGQALPAAGAGVWQVGAGFSFGPPDYTLPYVKGFTGYASYDINEHSGMIVEAHFMSIFTPQFVGESSYMVGARYGIARYRFHPYIKALVGVGIFQPKTGLKPSPGTNGYEVFAAGGGLEYRLNEHLNVQIMDFEYQGWPAFKPNGLTPWILTTGIARRF
jgi:hypothetical protein